MERVDTPPEEYLASLPADVGADMTALHERIEAALPRHGCCLWAGVFWGGSEQTIIGYGDMSYVRSDKMLSLFPPRPLHSAGGGTDGADHRHDGGVHRRGEGADSRMRA